MSCAVGYHVFVVCFLLLYIVLCLRVSSFFFLMIRRPPRSTLDRSSAASDVYKRQVQEDLDFDENKKKIAIAYAKLKSGTEKMYSIDEVLSLIHISEPTRPY